MSTGKLAGHLGIPVFGEMIKHNGIELHGTAHDREAPKITMAECREFNEAADRFFEKHKLSTHNWQTNSHRGITHRTTKGRPSCGG
mgnify:CR=1 FL=1